MKSPIDYGLSHPKWRPGQGEAVDWWLDRLAPTGSTVLEAPTGSGKSAIAAALGYRWPVTVVVCTRELQAQYADAYSFEKVWGRSHYPCVLDEHVASWLKLYHEGPTANECMYKIQGHKPINCPVYRDCPYVKEVTRAFASQKLVLNTAYAWTAKRAWEKRTGFRIFDEAHLLPKTISGLYALRIADRTRRYYGLETFPSATGSEDWAIEKAKGWLLRAIKYMRSVIKGANEARRDVKERLEMIRFGEKLSNALAILDTDLCYIETWDYRQKKPQLRIRPVTIAQAARAFIMGQTTGQYENPFFMSATIGDPKVLLSRLGLDEPTGEWFRSLPHPFPEENRQIFLVEDAPKMSKRSPAEHYAMQARMIDSILSRHEGRRGIILTSAWKHANAIVGLVNSDRLWLPSGDRPVDIHQFVHELPGDTVAVSPSWHNGIDLPDDAGRFVVIAKIPFPNLGDPVNKLLLKQPGGRDIYDQEAAFAVVQGPGRIVRHEDDWGQAYILDNNWSRVKRLAPQWFMPQGIKAEDL